MKRFRLLSLCRLPALLLLLLLLCGGCGSGGKGADSYIADVAPARWPATNGTITYWIEGGNGGLHPRRAVERGIHHWDSALSPIVLSSAASRETADIVFRLGGHDDLAGGEEWDSTSTTEDFSRQERAVYRVRVTVSLSRYVGGYPTFTHGEAVILQSLLPFDIEAAASHAAGHLLFCRGHSRSYWDCMYPSSLEVTLGKVSPRDKRTLRIVYSLPQ